MQQETSLLAYREIEDKLGEKQKEVYNMLKNLGSANNSILAKKLGWEINRVTPRVKELREIGLVVTDCIRPCPITKRLSMFWRLCIKDEEGVK